MRMMYRKHGHFLIYDKSKYTATITKNTKKVPRISSSVQITSAFICQYTGGLVS